MSKSARPPANVECLLTADEAAAFLRASRSKLARLVKAGQLPGYKVGATYVFYLQDLHDYVRGSIAAPRGEGLPPGEAPPPSAT